MEKEFATYEQALALKELGFKGSSFAYYIENRGIAGTGSDIELVYKHIHDTESFSNLICRVPTYSQAFRWFREKYNLHYVIVKAESWFYTINGCNTQEGFNTYEEAELECLKKLIEIVKVK